LSVSTTFPKLSRFSILSNHNGTVLPIAINNTSGTFGVFVVSLLNRCDSRAADALLASFSLVCQYSADWYAALAAPDDIYDQLLPTFPIELLLQSFDPYHNRQSVHWPPGGWKEVSKGKEIEENIGRE
jgi:hypothetical protein